MNTSKREEIEELPLLPKASDLGYPDTEIQCSIVPSQDGTTVVFGDDQIIAQHNEGAVVPNDHA